MFWILEWCFKFLINKKKIWITDTLNLFQFYVWFCAFISHTISLNIIQCKWNILLRVLGFLFSVPQFVYLLLGFYEHVPWDLWPFVLKSLSWGYLFSLGCFHQIFYFAPPLLSIKSKKLKNWKYFKSNYWLSKKCILNQKNYRWNKNEIWIIMIKTQALQYHNANIKKECIKANFQLT